jgi:signal transduction histidine kinase
VATSRDGFTVRLLRSGSAAPVGVGFVVDESHIVTCAHVVNTALGRKQRAQDPPDPMARVQVEFPMIGGSAGAPSRNCAVQAWVPPPSSGVSGGDIAGLVLVGDELPDRAGAGRLDDSAKLRDAQAAVHGYPGDPPRRENGTWAVVRLRGPVGGGMIQLDPASESTFRAQPGYSGSPVIVTDETGGDMVVGMLAAASDDGAGDAYAIPVAELARAWPDVVGRLTVPACPYRGLGAFTTGDADVFVGREDDVARLCTMVRGRALVMVTGPSGVGKSSLVSAGLIPRLQDEGWAAGSFRPAGMPVDALASALALVQVPGRTPTVAEIGEWVALIRSIGLGAAGARLALALGRPVVVHADQLEEILDPAACPPDLTMEFLELLLSARAAADKGLHIVATLRADFWAQLLEHPDAGTRLAGSWFGLSPMSRDRLERVITEPACTKEVRYQDGLAVVIAGDADGGRGLPLLEFALTQLWPHQRGREISLAAYQLIGGVTGALARHAEQAFADLKPRFGEDRIRRVMLNLVRSRAGASEATRRVVMHDQLGDDWPIVEELAARRLLVLDYDAVKGADTAELAHEALIQTWPSFAAWVDADADFRRWLTAMEDRVADDDLLSEARIGEAERWQSERADDIPANVVSFIERSKSDWLRRANELRDATEAIEFRNANDVIMAVGDQASNIIHRVNNIVGAMRAYIMQLQETEQDHREGGSGDFREALATLLRLAEKALTFPDEILQALNGSPVRVDVNDEIRSAIEKLGALPNITIDLDLSSKLPPLTIHNFDSILINLLRNAVYAMPDGGTLSVATSSFYRQEPPGLYLQVVVQDTGAGIPEDMLPRIFDLNYSTRNFMGWGSGLGLWWVRNFILRSGGNIVITSTVGVGSKATVRIPVNSDKSAAKDLQ